MTYFIQQCCLPKPIYVQLFSEDYRGPYNYSAPMQQTAALDAFVSAVGNATKCQGPHCGYDPAVPEPHQLTCEDKPCPSDQPCCAYNYGYYTCCESTQKCVYGECV